MMVELMLKAQPAAATKRVSPRVKEESLTLETKLAAYNAQLKVFA